MKIYNNKKNGTENSPVVNVSVPLAVLVASYLIISIRSISLIEKARTNLRAEASF